MQQVSVHPQLITFSSDCTSAKLTIRNEGVDMATYSLRIPEGCSFRVADGSAGTGLIEGNEEKEFEVQCFNLQSPRIKAEKLSVDILQSKPGAINTMSYSITIDALVTARATRAKSLRTSAAESCEGEAAIVAAQHLRTAEKLLHESRLKVRNLESRLKKKDEQLSSLEKHISELESTGDALPIIDAKTEQLISEAIKDLQNQTQQSKRTKDSMTCSTSISKKVHTSLLGKYNKLLLETLPWMRQSYEKQSMSLCDVDAEEQFHWTSQVSRRRSDVMFPFERRTSSRILPDVGRGGDNSPVGRWRSSYSRDREREANAHSNGITIHIEMKPPEKLLITSTDDKLTEMKIKQLGDIAFAISSLREILSNSLREVKYTSDYGFYQVTQLLASSHPRKRDGIASEIHKTATKTKQRAIDAWRASNKILQDLSKAYFSSLEVHQASVSEAAIKRKGFLRAVEKQKVSIDAAMQTISTATDKELSANKETIKRLQRTNTSLTSEQESILSQVVDLHNSLWSTATVLSNNRFKFVNEEKGEKLTDPLKEYLKLSKPAKKEDLWTRAVDAAFGGSSQARRVFLSHGKEIVKTDQNLLKQLLRLTLTLTSSVAARPTQPSSTNMLFTPSKSILSSSTKGSLNSPLTPRNLPSLSIETTFASVNKENTARDLRSRSVDVTKSKRDSTGRVQSASPLHPNVPIVTPLIPKAFQMSDS